MIFPINSKASTLLSVIEKLLSRRYKNVKQFDTFFQKSVNSKWFSFCKKNVVWYTSALLYLKKYQNECRWFGGMELNQTALFLAKGLQTFIGYQ